MAKGPTFDTITAAFASASLLNANFAAITTSFTNTISRDGSTPNVMNADFDMNSNDILNVGDIFVDELFIDGIPLGPLTLTGFTNWLSLTDTPSAFTSQAGKFVKVNSGETALEFSTIASSEPSNGDKGDITVSGSGLTWTIDAGVIDGTALGDNAVDLDQLAHGTTGDILYYGASGVPFRLAKGSDTEVLTLASGLPSWSAPSASDAFSTELFHVRDEQASGANGGTFTSGAWRTRTLNTTVTNEITSASLSSNQISLPAGTYWISANASARQVDEHKTRLRNITDSSDILIGTPERSDASDPSTPRSFLFGRFTLAGTKTIEFQHQCQSTKSTDGFGQAVGFSVVEIYSEVMIWKVA